MAEFFSHSHTKGVQWCSVLGFMQAGQVLPLQTLYGPVLWDWKDPCFVFSGIRESSQTHLLEGVFTYFWPSILLKISYLQQSSTPLFSAISSAISLCKFSVHCLCLCSSLMSFLPFPLQPLWRVHRNFSIPGDPPFLVHLLRRPQHTPDCGLPSVHFSQNSPKADLDPPSDQNSPKKGSNWSSVALYSISVPNSKNRLDYWCSLLDNVKDLLLNYLVCCM